MGDKALNGVPGRGLQVAGDDAGDWRQPWLPVPVIVPVIHHESSGRGRDGDGEGVEAEAAPTLGCRDGDVD